MLTQLFSQGCSRPDPFSFSLQIRWRTTAPTPWAEDLGCVIWDILSQRGSANVWEELDVSQTKQMAAAEDTGGTDVLLGASSFQVEDMRGLGSGGFWEQRELM